jgi:hypothetical protein
LIGAPASTATIARSYHRYLAQRIEGSLQVARFSRERPQIVKASIDLLADLVD